MLSGYARIDLRLSDSGAISVIEANPNPQLSRDEDFAESAAKAGVTYPELIQRIVNLGLRWEPARWG
jgi:D-alanine-D-alanine ligase